VPLLGRLFQGPPIGIGILTAGLILAIMVIPFIASVMRDVFEIVPASSRNPLMRSVRRRGKSCGTWCCLIPRSAWWAA